MTNDIDTLATALYVKIDDLLRQFPDLAPWRPRIGMQPRLSDAELVTLAVMQALLGYTSEARWVRHAHAHLGHLFRSLPSLDESVSTVLPDAGCRTVRCWNGPPRGGRRGRVQRTGLHSTAAWARYRGVAMRRFAMVGAVLTVWAVLGVLAPVAASTAAWADGPQHVRSTFSAEETHPAGQLCDFTYHNEFTITINAVIFPDGTEIDQDVIHATHTNVDTGFVLTETDYFSDQFRAGQEKVVGIQWHLRTPDGKLIVVHAGNLVFSSTGDVVSFTPNTNPDFAAVICPALGGQPAI